MSTNPRASMSASSSARAAVVSVPGTGGAPPASKARSQRRSPVRSHAIAVPSRLAVYAVRPSRATATSTMTPRSLARRVSIAAAHVASHTMRRSSRPAETRWRRSALNRRVLTGASWRPRHFLTLPVRRSSRRSEPSGDPNAIMSSVAFIAATEPATGNLRSGRRVAASRRTVSRSLRLEVTTLRPRAVNPSSVDDRPGIGRMSASGRPVRASQRTRPVSGAESPVSPVCAASTRESREKLNRTTFSAIVRSAVRRPICRRVRPSKRSTKPPHGALDPAVARRVPSGLKATA